MPILCLDILRNYLIEWLCNISGTCTYESHVYVKEICIRTYLHEKVSSQFSCVCEKGVWNTHLTYMQGS